MLIPDDSLSTPESNLVPKDGSPLTVSSQRSPQLYGNNNDYIPPPPPPSTAQSPQLHPARSPQQQEILLVSNATNTSFQSFQAPHTLPLSELNGDYTPEQELGNPDESTLLEYAPQDSIPSLAAEPETILSGQQCSLSSVPPRVYPIPDPNAGSICYNNNHSSSTVVDGNVTFVNCEPLEGGNKFRDGRYTIRDFWFNMQNYRKKEFYIGLVVSLAIVLGILGGTVWNHHGDNGGGGGSNPSPSPSSSGSTDHQCDNNCANIVFACEAPCDTSSSYKQCVAACPSTDQSCIGSCSISNQCFQDCNNAWIVCSRACRH